jgi:hypothetical protein
VGRLVTQGALVEEVTDEAEPEDGGGKGVACCLAVAAKQAGEELGAVFCRRLLDGHGVGWLIFGRTSAGDDAREGTC